MNFYRVRQRFDAQKLSDVGATVAAELRATGIIPGKRTAIAVGSRGIANLPAMVNEVAAWVREHGGEPFIVPAMGSHGGATAEGQKAILEGFGLTGIVSSMDVVQVGSDAFMDRQAWESDGVIVINRVKPHTSFHGRYESGLMKMIAVGLGKDAGARAIHRGGVRALRETMPEVARRILATGKILLGVAIVENARDETMLARALPARQIPEIEPSLLRLARQNQPYLPVEGIDLLIVDEMGKEISGTGMDTGVIGRMRIAGQPEPASPRIGRIFVRDLRGSNAYGIGLADVTTRRVVEKADWKVTGINAEASGFHLRAQLPAVVEQDEEAVSGERIVRIKNTLRLDELIVSEPVWKEIAGRDTIEMLGPANWDDVIL
jgi:hypothetical protein